jgi:glycine/D-amino acid oxidase-like deaminating enzyme
VTQQADVVVIGGGIVGAACAYYLCQAGLKVHLLERGAPASGTSRACDGLILLWDKSPGAELTLGLSSVQLWSQLDESLDGDFGYHRCGTIFLAADEQSLIEGHRKAALLGGYGVSAQTVDAEGLRSLEPLLAPDLVGGVYFPEDANLDPRKVTLALIGAAQQNGLTLHTYSRVTGIRRSLGKDGRITAVISQQDEISTETVVCTAGVWSGQIAGMVGVALPLKPRKGHVLVTARSLDPVRHALLEGAYSATVQSGTEDLQVALVAEMTSDGNLLLGSSRQFSGFDRNVSLDVVNAIAARAVRFLPVLSTLPVIRSYAGLRPWSPDHKPLIGPWEGVPGFYVATGHEGAGIGLAPVTGQLITKWIIGAELPPVAEDICPDRFEH